MQTSLSSSLRAGARLRAAALVVLLPLAVLSCGGGEPVSPADGSPGTELRRADLTGNMAADRATLERLEERARSLARREGCAGGACDAQPIGAKACGGPRYYLPYCPITTDVESLRATAAEIERFERQFNERYGIGSSCDVTPRPEVVAVGGVCTANPR